MNALPPEREDILPGKKIICCNAGFFDPFLLAFIGIVAAIAIPQFVAYKAKAEAVQLQQVAQLCIKKQQLVCIDTGKFPSPAETAECGNDRLPPDTAWTEQVGDGCKSLRVSASFLPLPSSSFLYKVECRAKAMEAPVCTTSRFYD